jgi:pSer/pThr/pTyr-binding forkhead associated (FHA) protein
MEPRLIVEIRFGRLSGRKVVVSPGAKLRVGRTDRADLVVAHDGEMSNVHFEIAWDGSVCTLVDLESAKGTWLDGQRVDKGEVAHRAWIRAGETILTVHVEGKTPPPRSAIEDDDDLDEGERARRAELRAVESARRARADEARKALSDEAARGPLYAVLDAARDPRILTLLREAPDEHRSLYEGTRGQALAEVAPHLVRFQRDSGLLERLITEGWEKRWGIFLACPLSLRDMRRHLRRFLMVEVEDTRERLYFRFYDPGVLREFMPTCTVRQVAELLGDAEAALCEGADGALLRYPRPERGRAAA